MSWRVLLEDLELAYGQIERGERVVFAPRTRSYQFWSERLEAATPSAAELAFWDAQTAEDLPRDFDVATASVGECDEVTLRLTARQTAQLLREVPAVYRTQVNDLLLTALVRAVCAWTGRPPVTIELESHGRALAEDVDVSRTVGWFTSLYPVRLAPADGLDGTIKAVKEHLRAVPKFSTGFAISRQLAGRESDPSARMTFNYLGQFDQSFSESSRFELAAESFGATQDEGTPLGTWLSVHGQVWREQLSLTLRYGTTMYRRDTVERLANAYSGELKSLIEHCLQADAGGVTPSDFPRAAVSQATLDRLPRTIEHLYPRSPLQQGLLFHSLYGSDGSGVYVSQLRVRVEGLEPARFARAWESAIARHEILRTGFVPVERGAYLQAVHAHAPLRLEVMDAPDDVTALAARERATPFELDRPPLLRLVLARTGPGLHELILTHHHVRLDGWSVARLLEEVLRAGRRTTSTRRAI